MKYRLLSGVIIAACSFAVYANNNANNNANNANNLNNNKNNNNSPTVCPSISSIQSVNVTNISKYENFGIWIGFQYGNKYDTQVTWDLGVIMPVKDNNTNERAAARFTSALSSLQLLGGPETNNEGYACIYASLDEEAFAVAVKPGMFNFNNAVNMKRSFS